MTKALQASGPELVTEECSSLLSIPTVTEPLPVESCLAALHIHDHGVMVDTTSLIERDDEGVPFAAGALVSVFAY